VDDCTTYADCDNYDVFAQFRDRGGFVEDSSLHKPMVGLPGVVFQALDNFAVQATAEAAMRIGNCFVLALMLGISADAFGQATNDLKMVPPNVVKDVLPTPTVPPTSAPQPSAAQPNSPYPSQPTDPSQAGPFNEPGGYMDDLIVPANTVPKLFWFRADYMASWIRKENSPPLIQSLPGIFANAGTIPPNAPNTIFPINNQLKFGELNGLRINTGIWLTEDHSWGLDVTAFATGRASTGAAFSSLGSPILARFYTNANNGNPTDQNFSNPTLGTGYSGAVSANATVNNIYSGDVNLRYNGYRLLSDNTDYLFGFRYFDFRESLQINSISTRPGLDPQTLRVADQFSVSNNFYGGQFGFASRWMGWRGFSFDGIVKMAVGSMDERATVNGSNSITTAGGTSTQPGGLLAQPSNIGNYQRNMFTVIPEVTLNLNYNFTQRSSFFIGWNYLWVSNVVRTANVIDPSVNNSNIRYIANPTPGFAPGPVVALHGQAFWMQGVNLGFKFEY
jgi:hypothetical protein